MNHSLCCSVNHFGHYHDSLLCHSANRCLSQWVIYSSVAHWIRVWVSESFWSWPQITSFSRNGSVFELVNVSAFESVNHSVMTKIFSSVLQQITPGVLDMAKVCFCVVQQIRVSVRNLSGYKWDSHICHSVYESINPFFQDWELNQCWVSESFGPWQRVTHLSFSKSVFESLNHLVMSDISFFLI